MWILFIITWPIISFICIRGLYSDDKKYWPDWKFKDWIVDLDRNGTSIIISIFLAFIMALCICPLILMVIELFSESQIYINLEK